jgi:hypothetical protein
VFIYGQEDKSLIRKANAELLFKVSNVIKEKRSRKLKRDSSTRSWPTRTAFSELLLAMMISRYWNNPAFIRFRAVTGYMYKYIYVLVKTEQENGTR